EAFVAEPVLIRANFPASSGAIRERYSFPGTSYARLRRLVSTGCPPPLAPWPFPTVAHDSLLLPVIRQLEALRGCLSPWARRPLKLLHTSRRIVPPATSRPYVRESYHVVVLTEEVQMNRIARPRGVLALLVTFALVVFT